MPLLDKEIYYLWFPMVHHGIGWNNQSKHAMYYPQWELTPFVFFEYSYSPKKVTGMIANEHFLIWWKAAKIIIRTTPGGGDRGDRGDKFSYLSMPGLVVLILLSLPCFLLISSSSNTFQMMLQFLPQYYNLSFKAYLLGFCSCRHYLDNNFDSKNMQKNSFQLLLTVHMLLFVLSNIFFVHFSHLHCLFWNISYLCQLARDFGKSHVLANNIWFKKITINNLVYNK